MRFANRCLQFDSKRNASFQVARDAGFQFKVMPSNFLRAAVAAMAARLGAIFGRPSRVSEATKIAVSWSQTWNRRDVVARCLLCLREKQLPPIDANAEGGCDPWLLRPIRILGVLPCFP